LIEVMPRPRWPHLLREVSRHGTVRWVVRVGHGPRIPIGHEYGTPEFSAAYQSAIRGDVVPPPSPHVDARSLRFLVERWQSSSAWSETGHATRQKRDALLKRALETSGDKPYKAVTRAHIIAGREKRAKTPAQANNFLAVMRALFKWAIKNDFVESDPTAGVEDLRRPNAARGIPIWTDSDMARFRERWALGTRERLAFEIMATTGLRRGDAAQLGRQHIGEVDGVAVIRLRTEKTGQAVVREIMPELKAAIDACPATGLALVARADGAALSKQSFGDWFREASRSAGVNKSPHGLRKHDAIALLHSGATTEEINASQGRMPHSPAIGAYTRERDDELLAARATAKLKAARKAKS
jgi:site-specific recombinase XerD